MSGVNDIARNKWSYEQLFAYFEEIAEKSEHINGFTRVDIMNLNRQKHDDLSTPFLGLEDPAIMPKNDTDDDIEWEWDGAFIICTEVEREDEAAYQEAMSRAGMILQKICAWILNDRELGHIVDFRFSKMRGHAVKQVFRNCAGYRMTFKMPSQFDMNMYAQDWSSWREGQAVPPFARVKDGAITKKLNAGDYYECSVLPALVIMTDAEGNQLDSTSVAPGGMDTLVAPSATITANGTPLGTALSGGDLDVHVLDEDDNPVGTVEAGTIVRIPNAPTFDNPEVWFNGLKVAEPGSGDTWFQIVKVNGELPDSVEWDIPNANFNLIKAGGGATLTIEVYLDAGLTIPYVDGVDFQDDIWIHINTVGITPTNHRFFVNDNGVSYELTEQAGATLERTVSSFNSIIIYAESDDGAVIAASLEAFELSVNSDAHANAVINAHNALSGMTMDTVQMLAVQGFIQRLKGSFTTHNSDLFSLLVSSNAAVFPYIPVSNTVASIAGYSLDIISLSNGTWVNITPLDVTVYGVVGESSKYLSIGRGANVIGSQNNYGFDAYSRTNADSPFLTILTDGTSSPATHMYKGSGQIRAQVNENNSGYQYGSNVADSLGLMSAQRTVSNQVTQWKRGVLLGVTGGNSITPKADHIRVNTGITGQYAGFAIRCGFTLDQMADWNEAIQWYQTNVITGGRHV